MPSNTSLSSMNKGQIKPSMVFPCSEISLHVGCFKLTEGLRKGLIIPLALLVHTHPVKYGTMSLA